MTKFYSLIFLGILALAFAKCGEKDKTTTSKPTEEDILEIPNVNRDSAYAFVAGQVAFGPRVPGTEAHAECRDWLAGQLTRLGAEVILQDFEAKFYHGVSAKCTNVIGQINPSNPHRVLLAAHWDSRFMADQAKKDKDKPIDGADDGASGVGVLLEIARVIQANKIDLGVDIVFFDAEDQGKDGDGTEDVSKTWCLGAQYWSKHPHMDIQHRQRFGILLDMVGSKKARFPKEGYSRSFARTTTDKIWKMAQDMGYSRYFSNAEAGGITDDHLFVNKDAKIPMVNIINLPEGSKTFGDYWHTHDDNMDVISKRTLGAVGNVVLAVIYSESDNSF